MLFRFIVAAALVVCAIAQEPCSQCPRGTFMNAQNRCESCPVGRASNVLGSITESDCESCAAGEESNVQGTQCVSCSPGKYSTGDEQCGFCMTEGSIQQYIPISGATSNSSCLSCDITQSLNGPLFSACITCPAGQYTILGGIYICQPCPVGYINPTAGQVGLLTEGGTDVCTACPRGYKPNDAQTQCVPCPAGTYGDDGATCTQCPFRQFNSATGQADQNACDSCGIGFEANEAQTGCTQCPSGKYSVFSGNGRYCQQCGGNTWGTTPGLEDQDKACDRICPTGTEVNANNNGCRTCPPGTYSETGSFCQECNSNDGYQPNSGAQNQGDCRNCGLGQQPRVDFDVDVWGDGLRTEDLLRSCETCEAGRYSEYGLDCFQCAAGRVSNAGAYRLNDNEEPCDECPNGKSAVAGRTKCGCEEGQWYETATEICRTCDLGRTSQGEELGAPAIPTTANGCSACEPGKYGQDLIVSQNRTLCVDCGAGKFRATEGATDESACQDCQVGRFSVAGSPECEACPAGTYQESEGRSGCTYCAEGKYSAAVGASNADTCQDCPAGKFSRTAQGGLAAAENDPNAFAGGPFECVDCPQGTYRNADDASTCIPCPLGTTSSSTGATSVDQCDTCEADSVSQRGAYGKAQWVAGPWSDCNGDCTMVRDVRCVNAWGQAAEGCLGARQPATSSRCRTIQRNDVTFEYKFPQCFECPSAAPIECFNSEFPNDSWRCASSINDCTPAVKDDTHDFVVRWVYKVSDEAVELLGSDADLTKFLARPDNYADISGDVAANVNQWLCNNRGRCGDGGKFEVTQVRILSARRLEVTGRFFTEYPANQFQQNAFGMEFPAGGNCSLGVVSLGANQDSLLDCQIECIKTTGCTRAIYQAGGNCCRSDRSETITGSGAQYTNTGFQTTEPDNSARDFVSQFETQFSSLRTFLEQVQGGGILVPEYNDPVAVEVGSASKVSTSVAIIAAVLASVMLL